MQRLPRGQPDHVAGRFVRCRAAQQPQTLDRAGARSACISVEGAYDLMGNLFEWTADQAGTFRGGDYVDTSLNGPGCLYATTAHDASYHDYSTGFRCCSNAPPPPMRIEAAAPPDR